MSVILMGMDTTTLPTDAVTLIENLDPDVIRDRLAELDRQSRALRVLLRSAVARQHSTIRRAQRQTPAGEVPHAR
jgi:hypothetical protein